MTIERTAINPTTWSQGFGFDQAVLVTNATRTLYVSGQTATNDEGEPQHAGDVAAQLGLALDNLEAVLAEADMTLADLVRLDVATTDVGALMPHYGVLAQRLGQAGATPPTTLLGVAALAMPPLVVELTATAAA